MSLYEFVVPQFTKMLTNLERWLDAAAVHAQKKSFDTSVLVNARLAPDQYPLVRQVQSACDSAKFAGARLTGKEAPRHPDTEQTLDELRARIKSTIEFLHTLKRDDFNGAETRTVQLPFAEGKVASGLDYLAEMATPNFYVHVTTAYAILRHNGVELGKRDYIGSLTLRDA